MEKLIKKLSALSGTSGYECRINEQIADLFKKVADDVRTDNLGNVIALKRCGKENAKKLVIEAHIDEIGLMVSDIDEHGFLSLTPVGGVDPRVLPCLEVTVHGKRDIKGIIGAKPPHIQNPEDKDKSAKMTDMAVDTGLLADEVKKLVRVGDSITFDSPCIKLGKHQLSGKSLDDRASVAVVYKVMEEAEGLNVDLYAVLSSFEEIGGYGARTAAYGINPDLAIAIDVCHGTTPDNSYSAFDIGSGTIISTGPNIHPKIFERLTECARINKIKHEIDVDGGDTGTDAWVMQVVREGIPMGLLSIPLKYMHTSVETMSIKDAEATRDLLVCFAEELENDVEGWLCL